MEHEKQRQGYAGANRFGRPCSPHLNRPVSFSRTEERQIGGEAQARPKSCPPPGGHSAAVYAAPVVDAGGQEGGAGAQMSTTHQVKLAHGALILATLIYSGFNIVAQLCMTAGVSPVAYTFYRDAVSAILLVSFAAGAEAGKGGLQLPDRGDLPRFFLIGFLMFAIQTSFIVGVKLTDANTAALLQCLEPVTACIMGVLLCMEKITLIKVLGALSASVGVFITQSEFIFEVKEAESSKQHLIGSCLLIVQGGFIALYCLHQKVLVDKYKPVFVTAYAYCTAATWMSLMMLLDWHYDYEKKGDQLWSVGSGWGLLSLIYAIVLSSCVGYCLRAWANQHVEATTLVLYNTLQSPVTAAIATAVLGQQLGWRDGMGSLLIFFGLIVVIRFPSSNPEAGNKVVPSANEVLLRTSESRVRLMDYDHVMSDSGDYRQSKV